MDIISGKKSLLLVQSINSTKSDRVILYQLYIFSNILIVQTCLKKNYLTIICLSGNLNVYIACRVELNKT